jgi:hypothetical protein
VTFPGNCAKISSVYPNPKRQRGIEMLHKIPTAVSGWDLIA